MGILRVMSKLKIIHLTKVVSQSMVGAATSLVVPIEGHSEAGTKETGGEAKDDANCGNSSARRVCACGGHPRDRSAME